MEPTARGRGLARLVPGFSKGVEGPEWEDYVLSIEGTAPSGQKTRRPKCFWHSEKQQLKELMYFMENNTRSQVRLNFCAIYLKSTTAALAEATEGLEQGVRVPSETSEW